MARPIWKGYITFGLVSIPVVLYPAENRSDIQFKLIDSRDYTRIRYERINEETGKLVPCEYVAKGFEYDDNSFIKLDDEELKRIAGQNAKTIDIDSFVDKNSIDPIFFERSYFLVPDKKGEKGYVILREALKNTKKLALAKVIIHTREYLAALMAYENALILNLLHYDQELQKPADFDLPSDHLDFYKISQKEIDTAKKLIASMTTKWLPENYQDEYRVALERWLDEKINEEKPQTKMKKRSSASLKKSHAVNFMTLLKKSLQYKKTHEFPSEIKSHRKTGKAILLE